MRADSNILIWIAGHKTLTMKNSQNRSVIDMISS